MVRSRPPRLLQDDKGRFYIRISGKRLEVKPDSRTDDWCKDDLIRMLLNQRVYKKRRRRVQKLKKKNRKTKPKRTNRTKKQMWELFQRPIEVVIKGLEATRASADPRPFTPRPPATARPRDQGPPAAVPPASRQPPPPPVPPASRQPHPPPPVPPASRQPPPSERKTLLEQIQARPSMKKASYKRSDDYPPPLEFEPRPPVNLSMDLLRDIQNRRSSKRRNYVTPLKTKERDPLVAVLDRIRRGVATPQSDDVNKFKSYTKEQLNRVAAALKIPKNERPAKKADLQKTILNTFVRSSAQKEFEKNPWKYLHSKPSNGVVSNLEEKFEDEGKELEQSLKTPELNEEPDNENWSESDSDTMASGGLVKGGLYSSEIESYMKHYRNFLGTFPIDRVGSIEPLRKKRFGFIMNLDRASGGGSHWIAVFIDALKDMSVEYYDSFGDSPPPLFMREIKRLVDKLDLNVYLKFKVNSVVQQRADSTNCGYFSMKFLAERFAGRNFKFCSGWSEIQKAERSIEKWKQKFPYI